MRHVRQIDLRGKLCPFPVVEVVRIVEDMKSGDECVFLVDDPLAIKSIPEELEAYPDIVLQIERESSLWNIIVKKEY